MTGSLPGRYASCGRSLPHATVLRFCSGTVNGCFVRRSQIAHHGVSNRGKLTIDPSEAVNQINDIRRSVLYRERPFEPRFAGVATTDIDLVLGRSRSFSFK